mgnify:CR=1 FL=1
MGSDRVRPLMANDFVDDDKMLEEESERRQDEEEHEEATEESTTKAARGPTIPSRWEKERHEIAHIPFRSWCATCVAGRGVRSPHKVKKAREEEELPRFSMDYGFLGQEDQATAVLLAMRELKTGMMLGMLVPKKGVGESWVERRIAQFINSFGHKKALFRSDNEVAIIALRKSVIKLCEGQIMEEDAIKGESQTNGLGGSLKELSGP